MGYIVLLGFILLIWIWLAYFLISRFHTLFGPHPDDPAETAGARSFGIAHIVAVWIGGVALIFYFFFKVWQGL